MNPSPPLPQTIWDTLPPEARSLIQTLLAQLDGLQNQVNDLKAQLSQNSSNSSRPPSTDPPSHKRRPPLPTSRKKRGGQPGHRRSTRPLVPPERLTRSVPCKPTVCRDCGHQLDGSDPTPLCHQVAEIPEIRPDVVEYQIHRLACPKCGVKNRGTLPSGVPSGAFGPRLQATIALLSGAYRLSKRRIRAMLSDLLGLSVATGSISKTERVCCDALAESVSQIHAHVKAAKAACVDETGWKQAGKRRWLWVAVTARATAFRIAEDRGATALFDLVGEPITPVLTCDRYSTYARAPDRQSCWAHLRRDFQAMIDRKAGGEEVGSKLLRSSGFVFAWWRRWELGSVHRSTLRSYVAGLKPVVRLQLEAGMACSCPWTAKVCKKLLSIEATLWRFATAEGVPPDNNAAERALRHGVIWRKTSFGTDSEGGSRFVERMLSVVETCRQQGRQVLGYLTDCLQAKLSGTAAPSLLA